VSGPVLLIGPRRLHSVASVQGQRWFPAYLAWLLNPDMPIPGFSRQGSRDVKTFLASIERNHYWTRHVYVPASTMADRRVVDVRFIQKTFYEGRPLIFSVEGLDYWMRVRDDDATHGLYWPCLLLPFVIGPHLHNGKGAGHAFVCVCMLLCHICFAVAMGCRLVHGAVDTLQDWTTAKYYPTWTK